MRVGGMANAPMDTEAKVIISFDGNKPFTTQPLLHVPSGYLPKQQWQTRSFKVVPHRDGDAVVWDSLAILEYLADKVGRDRFWPKDAVARGMARSMVAEMHSSYHALRGECPMNVRKRFDGFEPSEACKADILRILGLWAEARSRFGSGTSCSIRTSCSTRSTCSTTTAQQPRILSSCRPCGRR